MPVATWKSNFCFGQGQNRDLGSRLSKPPLKYRRIRSQRKLDADCRIVGGSLIILIQPASDFAGLHPHNRIVARCISCRPLEDLCRSEEHTSELQSPMYL